LLIAVCDDAYEHLRPEEWPRLHWSVPAPGDSDAAFEAACGELANGIDRLAPALAGSTA
jgi:hypothetical protein